MRLLLAAIAIVISGAAFEGARADPYRWCAIYGGWRGGGGTNCYFVTLQQCQWAVSGTGGFCRPNPFYTGPERAAPRKRTRRR